MLQYLQVMALQPTIQGYRKEKSGVPASQAMADAIEHRMKGIHDVPTCDSLVGYGVVHLVTHHYLVQWQNQATDTTKHYHR